MLFLLLFLALIVVLGVFAALAQAGMLPWFDSDNRGSSDSRVLDNPGCLLALIAATVVWFAAWGVVLVLSLGFLRSVI